MAFTECRLRIYFPGIDYSIRYSKGKIGFVEDDDSLIIYRHDGCRLRTTIYYWYLQRDRRILSAILDTYFLYLTMENKGKMRHPRHQSS